MPFGLIHVNVTQAFQRLMDTVCHGLESVFVHIDDILVASGDKVEHNSMYISCLNDYGNMA